MLGFFTVLGVAAAAAAASAASAVEADAVFARSAAASSRAVHALIATSTPIAFPFLLSSAGHAAVPAPSPAFTIIHQGSSKRWGAAEFPLKF